MLASLEKIATWYTYWFYLRISILKVDSRQNLVVKKSSLNCHYLKLCKKNDVVKPSYVL